MKPISRGSGVGNGLNANKHIPNVSQTIPVPGGDRSLVGQEYLSGNQSMMSGGSGLPDLKRINRSVNRGAANNLSSAGSGNMTLDSSKLRKASPEALALMMANKKKNDAASQGSS